MAWRGRGRGRGRGHGCCLFRPAKEVPFELFAEIEGLGTAKYSPSNMEEFIELAWDVEKEIRSSSYYYQDRSKRPAKVQKPNIEKYSDAEVKRLLGNYIKLDADHMPAELAGVGKQVVEKVEWKTESDSHRNHHGELHELDFFDKLEEKYQDQEGAEEKENEDDEEGKGESSGEEDKGESSDEKLEEEHLGQEGAENRENENEEEEEGVKEANEGEFSDEGDYQQNECFDDDEDDFNMSDDNDDEPLY